MSRVERIASRSAVDNTEILLVSVTEEIHAMGKRCGYMTVSCPMGRLTVGSEMRIPLGPVRPGPLGRK